MPRTGEKFALLKGKIMPAVVEAGTYLRSFPRHADQSKPAWMRAAGRYFGLTFSQTKKLYYGEVKTIDADTFLRMRARLDELEKAQIKRREILADAEAILLACRAQPDTGGTSGDCERATGGGGAGGQGGRGGQRGGR